ncbi:MAG: hypothetical protein HKL86_06815 [Acidimicrobiaceae bacterium]|nr:hypothetical protein [Acidimicrobiaceae bacterium]
MATFKFSETTSRSPEEVFNFLADMTNAKRWDPSIASVVRLEDGPVRRGSTFRVSLVFIGRTITIDYRLVRFDSPHGLVLRSESRIFVSEDTVTLGVEQGRTRVDYQARLAGKGLLALLDPVFRWAINHFGRDAGVGLSAWLLE